MRVKEIIANLRLKLLSINDFSLSVSKAMYRQENGWMLMLKESQLNHGAMSLRECKRFRDSLSHFSTFDSKNHLVVLHMMHDQLFSPDSTE